MINNISSMKRQVSTQMVFNVFYLSVMRGFKLITDKQKILKYLIEVTLSRCTKQRSSKDNLIISLVIENKTISLPQFP